METINRLEEAARDAEVVREVLWKLAVYASDHFEREEARMQIAGYSEFKSHLGEHAEFREWVGSVVTVEPAPGRLDVKFTDDLINFLKQWWKHHVTGTDQALRYLPRFGEDGPPEQGDSEEE